MPECWGSNEPHWWDNLSSVELNLDTYLHLLSEFTHTHTALSVFCFFLSLSHVWKRLSDVTVYQNNESQAVWNDTGTVRWTLLQVPLFSRTADTRARVNRKRGCTPPKNTIKASCAVSGGPEQWHRGGFWRVLWSEQPVQRNRKHHHQCLNKGVLLWQTGGREGWGETRNFS